uniref:G-protein coupled receptors family 1 profile domain-containing protein n=1 Tax=Meloidogyne enterolobii TaxID=390850 RepID=A0A6V7TY93_MELEN|nr:unnamed protein product [Meloidogyne enterolobii]
MSKSLPFKIFFTLFIFCSFYASVTPKEQHFSEWPEESSSKSIASVAEMPREDITLFFQRLASGHVGTTREFRYGQRNIERSEEGKSSKRRKIIVRPLVNAVLHGSASTSLPNTKISITNTPPTTSTKTTTTILPSSSTKNLKETSKNERKIAKSLKEMGWIVFIVIIGVFFSLATTIGNALVMLSICVDKKLQTISNYFLFSLAVADLTIGLISIPLMTLYTANETWTFGYSLCQFWLCIDYLMCNASALNLLLISFDRYFSVTRPLTYRPKRTTRKALIMISCTYTISLLLWPPWIVLWPYMEGRFIVEESSLCVVQFLVLGDTRTWQNQLATLFTSAAAFYIPVTLMIVLYYKVYLETRRRRKELRKLQAGQQQIRGLQPPPPPPTTSLSEISTLIPNNNLNSSLKSHTSTTKINFLDILIGNNKQQQTSLYNDGNCVKKKRERFSLLKFCTGRNVTTQSSSECISTEDSVGVLGGDDGGIGGEEEETCGLTTSNLDSIMAEQTAIELANNSCGDGGEFRQHENWESIIVAKAAERREALIEEERKKSQQLLQFQYHKGSSSTIPVGSFRSIGSGKMPIVELERTSRPSSVHTYNSIVIIEYPEGNEGNNKGGGIITSQRPSVRLSSQAEVESLSTRNSVERKFVEKEDLKEMKESPSLEEQRRLRLVKSAPGGRGGSLRLNNNNNNFSSSFTQQQQPNGVLMRKSEIQMIREEQMRQSEKERRRNERKQESKAAKTLSAILCAFIITCTPYHVIVCLEAFYPNSVPISLFTISYFLSYINSTINPLCYALCNARFRMTYMRIINCKWWGIEGGTAVI